MVNRLVMAAASPKVRRDMQVEDEILSEIEARDTTIMLKDKAFEQKDKVLEQKDKAIEQQRNILCATVKNPASRGMSVKEIAGILVVPEEEINSLLNPL